MPERNIYVIDGDAVPRLGSRPADGLASNRRRESREGAAEATGAPGWPRLGASLSMLVSGTGHFLHRQWGAGTFYLFVFGVVPAFHYFLHLWWSDLRSLADRNGLAEIGLLVGLLLVDLLLLAVLLGGVYSAWAVGRELSGAGADPAPHPLGPAVCSLLVPGWGQIANGQVLKAMTFLAVVYAGILGAAAWLALPEPIEGVVLELVAPVQPVVVVFGLATIGVVAWALSLYDAVLIARLRRRSGAGGARR